MDHKTARAQGAIDNLAGTFSGALGTAKTALSAVPKWPTTHRPSGAAEKLAALEADPRSLDDDTLARYIYHLEKFRYDEKVDCEIAERNVGYAQGDIDSLSASIEELDALKAKLIKVLEDKRDALRLYANGAWADLERYDAKLDALKAEQESRRPMKMGELIEALKEQGIDVSRAAGSQKDGRTRNKARLLRNKSMK